MNAVLSNDLIDEDYLEFYCKYVYDVQQFFDFDNLRWYHLPFSGGFDDQESQNPYKWAIYNYIVNEIIRFRNEKRKFEGVING